MVKMVEIWLYHYDQVFYTLALCQIILRNLETSYTAQKMKFCIKDFFSKCDQIRGNCGFGHIC